MQPTVKPFSLAALKVVGFTSNIILASFYFGEFKPNNSNTKVMPIKVVIISIFVTFNFTVLFWHTKFAK